MITCDLCGREEPDEAIALTWITDTLVGRQRTYCATCSRQHLRSMEGRLDREWW